MAGRGVALVLLAVAVTACDPAPAYGPQVPPYVGVTYAEDSVVATGGAQDLGIFYSDDFQQYQVALSLPAGAYASGARVTLRLVAGLAFASGDDVPLGQFLGLARSITGQGQTAVQVLPATPPPAAPLTLRLLGYDGTSYDVLHAKECDAAWQVVGTVRAVPLGGTRSSLSLQITDPGLWTVGQPGDGGVPATATPQPAASCPASPDGGGQ